MCPFCGTESPYVIDRDTGKVAEKDLLAALRDLPAAEQQWQATRRSVQCQSCRAVMVYEAERVGQNCEFCGSPALVAYDEIKSPIRPEGVLPFRIDRSRVRDDIRRWWRSKWFAPSRLARAALVDTVRSIYIPYWTFDAHARCPWEAEAGHYYYVNVEGRDSQGRAIIRKERRIRWEPTAGVVEHVFDDEPVPGTKGLPLELLRQVEPFPTPELVPYDTAFLSGHVVEHYQVVLTEASTQSQQQMHQALEQLCARQVMEEKTRQLCAQQVPGDTHRDLQVQADFTGQTFKHILVPIWLLTYVFGAKSFQVLVNGSTGRIAGKYPLSGWKIFFVVVIVMSILLILSLATES